MGCAVKEDGMKALALVEARDHVCCRYRISAFERALRASGWSLAIEPLAPGLLARIVQFARAGDFDAVILQRKLLPGWQIGELRRRAQRLIFDFDDAVLYRDSYDHRGPYHRRRRERFKRTVQVADDVIAGNDFLANCAIEAGAGPDRVRVIPTCVETETARPRPRGRDRLEPPGSTSSGSGRAARWPASTSSGRSGNGSVARFRGQAQDGLRPVFAVRCLDVVDLPWSAATENADVASGDRGDELGARRPLEPRQVRPQGPPVSGGRLARRRQPGRGPSRPRPPGVDGFLPTTTDEWVAAIRTLATTPTSGDGSARRPGRGREPITRSRPGRRASSPPSPGLARSRSPSRAGERPPRPKILANFD